jgi:putative ABC transport system permease protein
MPARLLAVLAVRNVGRNKARSALSLAAIAVGVAGLMLSGGFVRDLIHQLGEAVIHSQSGHLQVARSGYFDSGSRSPGKYLISPEQVQAARGSGLGHVRETMQRIGFSGLLNNGRSSYPIIGEGIEAGLEEKLGTHVVLRQGRNISAQDRYGVLIGAGVAQAMDLKLGSAINVVAPTVDEAMNTIELEVVGVFHSFSKDYDDRVIKIPLGAAQELLDTKAVNVVVLLLDATRHTAEVAQALSLQVAGRGMEVRTWESLNNFYDKTVALYDRQFGVLRLIVLLMVVLAVAGAINVAVLERAGEFGTMRALGNRSGDVFRLVMIEGVVMGAAGALLGVLLGYGLAWGLSEIGIPMPPPPNSNLEFTAQIRLSAAIVGVAALVGVVAAVTASVLPAMRVSRLPIVAALQRLI